MDEQRVVLGHLHKGFEDHGGAAEDKRVDPASPCQDFPLCQKNKKDQKPCAYNKATVPFLAGKICFLSGGRFMHSDSTPSRSD